MLRHTTPSLPGPWPVPCSFLEEFLLQEHNGINALLLSFFIDGLLHG